MPSVSATLSLPSPWTASTLQRRQEIPGNPVTVLGKIQKLSTSTGRRLRRMLGRSRLDDVKDYVGTDETSGQVQFELLKRMGCTPTSKVLEVGCGGLHTAVPLMQYLEPGNYAGIDPNVWLRETVMKVERVHRLVEERRPSFLSGDDFDASELGVKFDFVFSHSVLSHCAHWQLEQFLCNIGKVLAPHGKLAASLRLAEGNPYGNRGSRDKQDTMHPTWRYPGGVWFKLSTVTETADRLGLKAVYDPEFTEFYTQTRPGEVHDWVVFTWKERPA